jgi:hypothetical protein
MGLEQARHNCIDCTIILCCILAKGESYVYKSCIICMDYNNCVCNHRIIIFNQATHGGANNYYVVLVWPNLSYFCLLFLYMSVGAYIGGRVHE